MALCLVLFWSSFSDLMTEGVQVLAICTFGNSRFDFALLKLWGFPCDKINLDLIVSTHVAKVKGFKCLKIQ